VRGREREGEKAGRGKGEGREREGRGKGGGRVRKVRGKGEGGEGWGSAELDLAERQRDCVGI
jgi:hypothetical protein